MAGRDRHSLLTIVCIALGIACSLPAVFLLVRAFELGSAPVIAVFRSSTTWLALGRTLILAAAMSSLSVALALPIAWLIHGTDIPAQRALRILTVLPLAVPSYVGGFVVLLVLAPGGLLPVDGVYGIFGVMVALLFTFPLALLTISSGLSRLDPRQWESARSLGMTPARAFVRVVLPQLRPSIASGGLLVALYSVGDFGAVSLLRYESLSYLIYVRYKSLFDRDEAIVLALILAVVASALVFLSLRIGGGVHRDLRATRMIWRRVPLGSWKWPSFLFCVVVVLSFVGLPLAVVIYWLARGLARGQEIPFPTSSLMTSAWVSALAAVVLVSLAYVPTVASRTVLLRGVRWIRGVSHLGYALPGIVVALAVVSMSASHLPVLYQTTFLLLFAYLVRFFPLAIATIDDSLGAHGQSLFRAARSLGSAPSSAFLRVLLPITWPAAAFALLAVFIAVVKELPATLILSPPNFSTLATDIWGLTEDAYFAAAAPAVLVLVALAAAGLMLGTARKKS